MYLDRLRQLLPRDTRAVEIVAAVSMIANSMLLVIFAHDIMGSGAHFLSDRIEVWMILCFIMGVLQLVSIIMDPELMIIRIITAWATGFFLMWDAGHYAEVIERLDANIVHIEGVVKFFVGLSNIYAFVILMGLARDKWKA